MAQGKDKGIYTFIVGRPTVTTAARKGKSNNLCQSQARNPLHPKPTGSISMASLLVQAQGKGEGNYRIVLALQLKLLTSLWVTKTVT